MHFFSSVHTYVTVMSIDAISVLVIRAYIHMVLTSADTTVMHH